MKKIWTFQVKSCLYITLHYQNKCLHHAANLTLQTVALVLTIKIYIPLYLILMQPASKCREQIFAVFSLKLGSLRSITLISSALHRSCASLTPFFGSLMKESPLHFAEVVWQVTTQQLEPTLPLFAFGFGNPDDGSFAAICSRIKMPEVTNSTTPIGRFKATSATLTPIRASIYFWIYATTIDNNYYLWLQPKTEYLRRPEPAHG